MYNAEVVQSVFASGIWDTFRLPVVQRSKSLFWWLWPTQTTLAEERLPFTSTNNSSFTRCPVIRKCLPLSLFNVSGLDIIYYWIVQKVHTHTHTHTLLQLSDLVSDLLHPVQLQCHELHRRSETGPLRWLAHGHGTNFHHCFVASILLLISNVNLRHFYIITLLIDIVRCPCCVSALTSP